MAILDSKLSFSDNQAYSAGTAGTVASTNVIDLGVGHTTHYPGNGTPLYVNATISTTATTNAGNSIQAVLQDSANDSSFATIVAGPVIDNAIAEQTIGKKMLDGVVLPSSTRRYVRLAYIADGNIVNTGCVTAQLSLGNIDNT